jgi:predicted Zn-dependent protease
MSATSPDLRPRRHPCRAAVAALVSVALGAQPVVLAAQPTAPPPFVTGAAQTQALPDLGDESQAAITAAQERKLGESIVRQIRAAGAYLEDPEVNDYLNEIGHRLVAAIPDGRQDFEFFAMADPSINAFALPGGYIGVNTGLILMTQSESELASVLAHEITHVTQRHMSRGIAGQQNSWLYMLGALAVAVAASRSNSSSSGQAASAAIASGQALAIQTQINFTRENEYEADRIGFQRLDAAGFDVYAMATMMERLQKSSRFADGSAPSYLRDHPVTYERVAEAQARAYGKPYRQVTDSLEFHLVRALLRSYSGTSREAVTYFRDALAERKFNSEVAARYGLVASLLRDEDYPQAMTELEALEKIAPPHPMIEAMAAHVLMESGKLDLAIARFKAALTRYPNKMQLIYDYPQALAKAGRAREAATFLDTELARFPDDGPLHRIAARTYAELGQKQQEHRHQGEFYAWQGDFKGAVRQFELASKAGDGDFYQTSVVEARLRTLRKELAEQQAALGKNG